MRQRTLPTSIVAVHGNLPHGYSAKCPHRLGPNNSFKPTPHRGVGHVPALRLHASAAPLRGGLTQALGGRKNIRFQPHFSCSAAPLTFAPLPSLAAALIPFCNHAMLRIVRLARSRFTSVAFVRFVKIGWFCLFSATDTVASVTSGCDFAGARSGLPASSFGKCARVPFASASTAT